MKKLFITLLIAVSFTAAAQIKVVLKDTVSIPKGKGVNIEMIVSTINIEVTQDTLISDSVYSVYVHFIAMSDSVQTKVFIEQVPLSLQFHTNLFPTAKSIRREYRKLLRSVGRKPRG